MQKAPKKPQITEKTTFPMRINRYLAFKGYCTRRGGDELIKSNKVFINGNLAVVTDKVWVKDVVEVRNFKKPDHYVYYAYNKPAGIITHSPQNDEKDIKSVTTLKDVFPVGRLDKDSHGLIILTNDGRITDRLLNPIHTHEKEYLVSVKMKLRSSFKEKMEKGIDIEGYVTEPCKIEVLDDTTFKIILHEGKKHQIKRMCVALFNEVIDLKRIRVMNIELGKLKEGQHREINGDELNIFLKNLGL